MKVLASSNEFDKDMFSKLLVRQDTPHIFLTETHDLINAMAAELPELISVDSIGKSYQGREIPVIRIDGLRYVQKMLQESKAEVQKPDNSV